MGAEPAGAGRYAGTYELAAERGLVVHPQGTGLWAFDTAERRYLALTPGAAEATFTAETGAGVTFLPGRGGAHAADLLWRAPGGAEVRAPRTGAYATEAVRFANGDTVLAGELLRPSGPGPHPAAVLVHGSGPADRASAWGLRHFLAWHGVAVLSYDKRGVGESESPLRWWQASFDVLAGDALAGVQLRYVQL